MRNEADPNSRRDVIVHCRISYGALGSGALAERFFPINGPPAWKGISGRGDRHYLVFAGPPSKAYTFRVNDPSHAREPPEHIPEDLP